MVEPFELQSRFVRAMRSGTGARLSPEELKFLIDKTAMLDDLSKMVVDQLKEMTPCQEQPQPSQPLPCVETMRPSNVGIIGLAPQRTRKTSTSTGMTRPRKESNLGQRAQAY